MKTPKTAAKPKKPDAPKAPKPVKAKGPKPAPAEPPKKPEPVKAPRKVGKSPDLAAGYAPRAETEKPKRRAPADKPALDAAKVRGRAVDVNRRIDELIHGAAPGSDIIGQGVPQIDALDPLRLQINHLLGIANSFAETVSELRTLAHNMQLSHSVNVAAANNAWLAPQLSMQQEPLPFDPPLPPAETEEDDGV